MGDEQFVARMLAHVEKDKVLSEIPKAQRRSSVKPLADYVCESDDRNTAIVLAYRSGGYTLAEIGEHLVCIIRCHVVHDIETG